MNRFKLIVQKHPFRFVGLAAVVASMMAGLVLASSLWGWPERILRFEEPAPARLSADTHIAGSASFDKDSYYTGEIAVYKLHVLYRKSSVEPDFDGFRNRISFFPFELLAVKESIEETGDGITRYELEYQLQVTGVRRVGSYEFDPAVVYYSQPGSSGALQSFRLAQPRTYIASYYPGNVGKIELLETKGKIHDPVSLRQGLLALGTIAFMALAAFVLLRFGRRRKGAELSEAERLWREFNEVRYAGMDNRAYLLRCERIFSGILQRYVRMSPETFWSGASPDDGSWSETVTKARETLRRIYQSTVPGDDDVREITLVLERALAVIVDEARLKREQEPSFTARLMQQPRVLVLCGFLIAISVLMLSLTSNPSIWASPDIVRYNRAVTQMRDGSVRGEDLYTQLSSLGDAGEVDKVKAASFYNAGTARASEGFSGFSQPEQKMLLGLVFQAPSPEALLQTILLSGLVNSEEEIVMMLVNAAEQLRRAELNLRKAAKIRTNDEEILRNLELMVKRKDAVLVRLAQLRDLFKAAMEKEADDEAASEQGLFNIIDSELPEEYKEEEMREGERAYMIFERF